MSKSMGRVRLGNGHRSGTLTVIEAPVWHSFRRRARVTFYVVAGVVGLLAATVAAHHTDPIVGLMLGVLIGVGCGMATSAVVLAWPVLRVFGYWAVEILLGLGLVYGWQALMASSSLLVSLVVVGLVLGVPAAVTPLRRRIVALGWCVVVRHRLRMCFASFIVANIQGSRPLILLARPTPAGERVWVWLRPGLALTDLEGATKKLAVACWADEVRVVRASTRYAALIRVDVTRRNPLADQVDSPLVDMVPDNAPCNAPTSPGMPPLGGLDLPDVPEEPEPAPAERGRRPRNTPARGTVVDEDDRPDFGSDNADWA